MQTWQPDKHSEPAETSSAVWRNEPLQGLWCALALGLTAAVFAPIIHVYFHDDDYLHLYNMANLPAGLFLLKMHGGHLQLTRNAALLAIFWLFRGEPVPYMVVMLLTHLVNVVLLYCVARRLTHRAALAGLSAALWGAAPLQSHTLAWMSVYGQPLAVAAVLWVLLQIVRVADGETAGRFAPWSWAVGLFAASSSFGSGLAVAAVMPIIAWLLLPASHRRPMALGLAINAVIIVVIYFTVAQLNQSLDLLRDTNTFGALPGATPLAAATLWTHGAAFFLHLITVAIATLELGWFFNLDAYPGPLGWAALTLFAASVGLVAHAAPEQRRRLAATLLFALAPLALIAFARSPLSDAIDTPRLYVSGRYHYTAQVGLVLTLTVTLAGAFQHWRVPIRAQHAFAVTWVGLIAFAWWYAGAPIDHFDRLRRGSAQILSEVDVAAAAAPPGADVFVDDRPFALSKVFNVPGRAGLFAALRPTNMVDGRRIFFVVADPKLLQIWRSGERAPGLLVSPEEKRARQQTIAATPP